MDIGTLMTRNRVETAKGTFRGMSGLYQLLSNITTTDSHSQVGYACLVKTKITITSDHAVYAPGYVSFSGEDQHPGEAANILNLSPEKGVDNLHARV